MKSFAAFMKSPVGKLHSTFAFFILFNLISGFINEWVRYAPWLAAVHFYTGLMIFAVPAAYLAFAKNRRIVFGALIKMLKPSGADFRKGKTGVLLFKSVTWAAIALILLSALGGILMKFRLLPILSYNVHAFDFKALLALVPLHAILAAALRARHAKKPVSRATPASKGLHG